MIGGEMWITLCPCLISSSYLKPPIRLWSNNASCNKSRDSNWPKLGTLPTQLPANALNYMTVKRAFRSYPLTLVNILASCLSASSSSLLADVHVFFWAFLSCVSQRERQPLFETPGLWCQQRSCSIALLNAACLIACFPHNGCPISWLSGLLIRARRRENRGSIGVLGWTLWLEGTVCDAKRQCHVA